jgi:hypothetical protein
MRAGLIWKITLTFREERTADASKRAPKTSAFTKGVSLTPALSFLYLLAFPVSASTKISGPFGSNDQSLTSHPRRAATRAMQYGVHAELPTQVRNKALRAIVRTGP